MFASVIRNEMNNDVNPIIDPSAETLTSGVIEINEVCENIGIEVAIE